MAKNKYYSLLRILKTGLPLGALYYMVFGERSNGKTYQGKELGLNGIHDKEIEIKGFIQDGSQFAIVRRWQDDFKGKRGAQMFDDLVENGSIKKWTNGKWDNVSYYAGRWYLAKYDEEQKKLIKDVEPFAHAFAISTMEHDKSTNYPRVNKIIFDEFLTRGSYLPDEFTLFMNVISTIVRDRKDVLIFMFGNTVNQYCPYFEEMGLTNIKKMNAGDIDVYNYGESDLHVCVEYADTATRNKKASDVYFAFNNPKLAMITGGAWEMAIYPHAPCKWKPRDVAFNYFIKFGGDILQCEVIECDGKMFTYIHRKTTPIKDEENDLIYSTEYNPLPNWKRKITKPTTPLEQKLLTFFYKEKVFYQDNQVGEIVRNYLLWCKTDKIS